MNPNEAVVAAIAKELSLPVAFVRSEMKWSGKQWSVKNFLLNTAASARVRGIANI